MTNDRPDRLLQVLGVCFAIFVFSSTFSIALAQTSLGISLILFLVTTVRNKDNPFTGSLRLPFTLILLYLVWLLAASLAGKTPLRSVLICKEEWLFTAIPIGIHLFRDRTYAEKVMYGFAVALGIVSLYAISQFFTGSHWLHYSHGTLESVPVLRPLGNFTHWLTFANYYAVAGIGLVGYLLIGPPMPRRRSVVILAAAILALVSAVLTASRMPIIAILLLLVFCAAIRPGRVRATILGTIGGLVLLVMLLPASRQKFSENLGRDTSTDYEGSRVYIWTRSLDIVKQHPIFGVGQGNFQAEYMARLDPNVEERRKLAHAHNDLINVAAIAGVPGALLFLGVWVACLRHFARSAFNMALDVTSRSMALAALVGSATFFLTSMTEATFADEEVRQMLMFFWAIGLSVGYKEQQATEQNP